MAEPSDQHFDFIFSLFPANLQSDLMWREGFAEYKRKVLSDNWTKRERKHRQKHREHWLNFLRQLDTLTPTERNFVNYAYMLSDTVDSLLKEEDEWTQLPLEERKQIAKAVREKISNALKHKADEQGNTPTTL